MKPLTKLQEPIREELREFEKSFKLSLKSTTPLLDKIANYIVQRKGKQIRPMFVLLSAKLIAPVTSATYVAASLIEILHTATLVHDDVVDDSNLRRGFFSVNALWKNKIAVLVGDYFFSRGLLLALENKEYDILQIYSRAVREMSEGELLQIEKARGLNITEPVYYDIIRQKTASLIGAACASGAHSTGALPEQVETMRDFGYNTGIAFQIKDDLFDYGHKNIGKPTGIDIKEKKMTLPLIYAMNQSDGSTKRYIKRLIRKKSGKKKVQEEIIAFVKDKGGIEYAEKVMNEYIRKALDNLSQFEDNEAKIGLQNLISFVVERRH